jgi:hypothetical protein
MHGYIAKLIKLNYDGPAPICIASKNWNFDFLDTLNPWRPLWLLSYRWFHDP